MNRHLKNVIAASATAVLLATPAFAARRTALSNNVLIKDKDDVFIYPQLMLDYRNLINFDYGTGETAGSGMLLLGSRTFGFGVLVNRADINPGPLAEAGTSFLWNYSRNYELDNLGSPSDVLGEGATIPAGGYPDPLTFIDLVMGFDLGRNLLGFRLGIGTGGDSAANGDESNSQFALKLTGGMSFGKNFDLAADIVYATGQQTSGGDLQYSGSLFALNANLRGFSPMGEKIDLGYFGQLAFGSQTLTATEDNPGTPNESASDVRNDVLVVGGLGPVYKLNKMNSTVAAYGVIGLGFSGRDPNTVNDNGDYGGSEDDGTSDLKIIIPGFRMSLETSLLDWLVFRSGMEYTWMYNSDTTGDGEDASSLQEGNFGWNAGLGIIIGDFTLDGAFQQNWLTQGPDFLGGDAPMFLEVSATYTF
ncbi:MAG: hypothetical protein R3F65_21420 [bacterium]|nr:hypothetical protein [Myxococcales bacterium]MCB9553344.1 hypothetical protein [Myxococcales bacterium]